MKLWSNNDQFKNKKINPPRTVIINVELKRTERMELVELLLSPTFVHIVTARIKLDKGTEYEYRQDI